MKEGTKVELQSIICEASRKAREPPPVMVGAMQNQPSFKTQFRLLRANVIKPVLEEFKGRLEREGYRIEVIAADESLDSAGERPDCIIMRLLHADLLAPPRIEFLAYRRSERVDVAFTIATCNELKASVRGTYSLREISTHVVETLTLHFLRELSPHKWWRARES